MPDDWVNNNNMQSVKLMKYSKGAWTDLNTEKIGANTYKAQTLGFCSFAIVGTTQALAAVPTPGTQQATSAPTATPAAPEVTGTPASAPSAPPVNFALVIGAIIVIAIVVVVIAKRKEIFK